MMMLIVLCYKLQRVWVRSCASFRRVVVVVVDYVVLQRVCLSGGQHRLVCDLQDVRR